MPVRVAKAAAASSNSLGRSPQAGQNRGAVPLGYRRRRPEEETVLYQVVQEHLATFLAEARERSPYGAGLPRRVEREFAAYLDCGILARGFARVRCGDCGNEILVASFAVRLK